MKRRNISALVFLAFLASLFAFPLIMLSEETPAVVIASDEDDDVDGVIESRNFNNRASIAQFQLKYASGSAVQNFDQIDPQTTYRVELTVNEPDTIRDLKSLEVRFFNSSVSGTSVTPGEVSADFNNADSIGMDGQEFVVKWTADGSDSTVDTFELITNSATYTWSLNSIDTPELNDMNKTSHTFIFDFQISKVAPYFKDLSTVWYFGAIIEDGRISLESEEQANEEPVTLTALTASATQTNTGAYDVNGASSWKVNWYGEIGVGDPQIEWSNLPAGVTFGAAVANTSITSISLLSNGQYDSQIRNKQAHWNAIMTTELAEIVFEGFTETDFGNFRSEYNASVGALQADPYNFDIPDELSTVNNTFAALNGLPYEVINILASLVNRDGWLNFSYNLQAPETGVNTTGATMVADSTGFEDLLDDDITLGEYQAFAIGFITYGAISQAGVEVTVDGTNYYLVATSDGYNDDTPFHSFADEDGAITKAKTDEDGDNAHLDLYIALSRIYQNARYEGVLQLKITDPLN